MEFDGLFRAGILAGEEFIVRFRAQPALDALDALVDRAHLLARISLVRKLIIVVPSIMVPTISTGVIVLPSGGIGLGFSVRIMGAAALLAFLLRAFVGTMPMNIKVNETWSADDPRADWKRLVKRWEFTGMFRAAVALLAFALLLVAVAVRIAWA